MLSGGVTCHHRDRQPLRQQSRRRVHQSWLRICRSRAAVGSAAPSLRLAVVPSLVPGPIDPARFAREPRHSRHSLSARRHHGRPFCVPAFRLCFIPWLRSQPGAHRPSFMGPPLRLAALLCGAVVPLCVWTTRTPPCRATGRAHCVLVPSVSPTRRPRSSHSSARRAPTDIQWTAAAVRRCPLSCCPFSSARGHHGHRRAVHAALSTPRCVLFPLSTQHAGPAEPKFSNAAAPVRRHQCMGEPTVASSPTGRHSTPSAERHRRSGRPLSIGAASSPQFRNVAAAADRCRHEFRA